MRNFRVVGTNKTNMSIGVSVYRISIVETLFICRGKFVPGPCLELGTSVYNYALRVIPRPKNRGNRDRKRPMEMLLASAAGQLKKLTLTPC